MIIFESYLIARAFTKEDGFHHTGLKMDILSGASFAVLIALIIGFLLKVYDFADNGKFHLLTVP